GTYINTDFNPGAVKLWYSSLSTLTNNHANFNSLGTTVQLATANLPPSGSNIIFSGLNQRLGGTYYLYTTLDVPIDVTGSNINIGSMPLSNIVISGAPTRTGADPIAAAGIQTIRKGMYIDISRVAPTSTVTVPPNDQNIVLFALKLVQSSAPTQAYHLTDFSVTPNGNYLTGDLVPNSFKLWLHTNSTNATLASDGIPIESKPITASGVPVIWTDLNTEIPGCSTRYLIITVDISANPSNGRYIYIPNNPFSNIDFEEEHNKTGSNPTLAGAAVVFASLSSVNFQCPLADINYKATKNANSTNIIIYPFKLTNTIVPNTAVPVLDAINLITNGSYLSSDIKPNSVKLWKSTVSNLAHGFNPASANLLQTIDIVPVEGTLSFSNLNLTLNSGANYFYITIDIFSGCNNANFIYINSAVFDNFIFIDPISKIFTSPISYPFAQGHTITFASSVWKSSAGTTDWLNTANWADATVPDNLVSTIIQPGVNQPIISSGTYNVYNLTCNLSSSLTIEPNNSTATLNISNNLIIKNGANFIINAGTGEDINVTVKNVIIEAGGTLTIVAGQKLTVTGNWSCDGTVTCGINYGTIVFQGTEEQSISGGTFNNFTIDNSSGVYLTGETGFNGVLKILAGDFDTSDQLKLVSNATQTGCISGSGAGTITGTVTVQRYNTGSEGYHYISAPTANTTFDQIIDDMAGNAVYPQEYETYTTGPISHLWEYDETNISQTLHPTTGYSENDQLMMNGWRAPDPTSAMVPIKGYSANIPAGSGLEVTETVNNGPYSLAVTYTNSGNAEVDGWNLMGNPYPSPIDWDAAAGWTKTNVNDAIYFFVPTSKYAGQHHTYIGGVGNPGTVTGIIPMFQAFWVKTTDNGTLGVTNTVRVDNTDPTFYKKTIKSDDKQLIRLKGTFLSNTNLKDETVVYFSDGPTRGFDGNYDAYKLMNNDGSPNIYTMTEGSKLSINGLPTLTEENESVPLEFDVTSKGEYRLEAIEIKDFAPVTEILLEDKFLGIMQDLKLNPSYVFNINTSDKKGRFLLHFKPEITDINTNKVSEYIRAYTFGKNLVIGFNSSDVKAKADINIYNIFGQKVISDKTIGIGTHNIQLDLATGFYYVRMTYNNRTVAQKVFIE
ncbi:MAG: T9SS type A sorting domain-containing protein, partial [Bacteroidales bacterium]|nr:T9SS type A sorting domain-containing protein [Bacteroidales bacterium]